MSLSVSTKPSHGELGLVYKSWSL